MIINELKKTLRNRSVYYSIIIGVLSCCSGIVSYSDTAYWSSIVNRQEEISAFNAWLDCLSIGSSFYRLIFPFLIIPMLDSYLLEKKEGYHTFIVSRSDKIQYYLSKWAVGSFSAVVIIGTVLIITLLICLLSFPWNDPVESMTHLTKNFGLVFFLIHPIEYIVLLIISNMYMSFVYFSIGFSCSCFIKNRYVLLLIPFIIFVSQLIIWQFLDMPLMSPLIFIAYYEVYGLTPINMIIVGIVYLICTLGLLLLSSWKENAAI